jgi:Tfp pilus assembly protein PilO
MGDMLVDINKAAQARGLAVELFRPGGEAPREFYAEVPITLNLTGSYHDIGAFTGDLARLAAYRHAQRRSPERQSEPDLGHAHHGQNLPLP